MIDPIPSPVNPILFERESHESVPNQPLVEKVVDSIPPSIYCTLPLEGQISDRSLPFEVEVNTTRVLLISLDPIEQGDISPVLT